jgi:hypothetical protein
MIKNLLSDILFNHRKNEELISFLNENVDSAQTDKTIDITKKEKLILSMYAVILNMIFNFIFLYIFKNFILMLVFSFIFYFILEYIFVNLKEKSKVNQIENQKLNYPNAFKLCGKENVFKDEDKLKKIEKYYKSFSLSEKNVVNQIRVILESRSNIRSNKSAFEELVKIEIESKNNQKYIYDNQDNIIKFVKDEFSEDLDFVKNIFSKIKDIIKNYKLQEKEIEKEIKEIDLINNNQKINSIIKSI